MRTVVGIFLALTVVGCILIIYWQQELSYALPTPVPQNYQAVPTHSKVMINDILSKASFEKPVFLHFFSAECVCSRFNLDHFQSLVKKYRDSVDVYMIVLASPADARAAVKDLQYRYHIDVPILIDEDEELAKKCGVYATPQAVMLDTQGRLYYRGNYNRFRFCTSQNTNYAQFALDSLVAKTQPPDFGEAATLSYGCELPSAQEKSTSWFNIFF